jgi:hypothetical protein
MRVQLEGQTLRLRVDEAELAQLLAGGDAGNRTQLPDGQTQEQRVRLTAQLSWRHDESRWQIGLPEAEVRALSTRLPSRDGLRFDLPTPDGGKLELLFDVDVRDSARKRLHKSSEGDSA